MNESRSDPTLGPVSIYPEDPGQSAPMARPTVRFMLSNPAHWLALGFGSGL